jgi:pumilio family protein 6
MPSATSSKASMSGTKRKAESVKPSKKDSKKAKIDSDSKKEKKSKKIVKEPTPSESDEPSDDELDAGGVSLEDEEDEEMDDAEEKINAPKAQDGLHPERAKAAANAGEFGQVCRYAQF